MTKVTLHKVVRPGAQGRTRTAWTLRWYGTDGRRLGQTRAGAQQRGGQHDQQRRRALRVAPHALPTS